MQLLTVVILTYNEAKHIARALRSVAALDARVLVVDSFSADDTVEIARAEGALVVQNAFVNQAQQMQWALLNMPVATSWVMRLDADEVLTPELIDEISRRLPTMPADVTGINLKRRHIFLGRWIRHGGRYPRDLAAHLAPRHGARRAEMDGRTHGAAPRKGRDVRLRLLR